LFHVLYIYFENIILYLAKTCYKMSKI